MKFILLTNTLNPHMKSLADSLYELLGDNFAYISLEKIDEDRKLLGWRDYSKIPYHILYWDNQDLSEKYINNCDVLYFGANKSDFKYVNQRMKLNKTILFHSERLFKISRLQFFHPILFFDYLIKRIIPSYKKNNYILAASYYLNDDYKFMMASTKRMLKFGYFPKYYEKNIDKLMDKKNKDVKQILITSRLLKSKKIDEVILTFKKIVDSGYSNVILKIFGAGPEKQHLINLIHKLELENYAKIYESLSPEEVRLEMDRSHIYIMSSNKAEGWGAVVNESMNSGCAVISSSSAGSTNFLIKNGFNGLVYSRKIKNSLYFAIKKLLDDDKFRIKLGGNAYETIESQWNHKVAASRLVEKFLLNNTNNEYKEGPLSPFSRK